MKSQWSGKKVAFLGDSITDACHVGTERNYWQFLADDLEIEPLVYGVNGCSWLGIHLQTEALFREHPDDVDAICIFMGTNDYNGCVPVGEWWTYREEETNYNGKILPCKRRCPVPDDTTLRGAIQKNMKFLKEHFPLQQIILFTPLHRGFAVFDEANVQPEESYPNRLGKYLEEYIAVIREAGDIWSVPVIDLYRLSGLLPVCDAHARFFHDGQTDRLHPNAAGHRRIAQTLMYQMLALPATFR